MSLPPEAPTRKRRKRVVCSSSSGDAADDQQREVSNAKAETLAPQATPPPPARIPTPVTLAPAATPPPPARIPTPVTLAPAATPPPPARIPTPVVLAPAATPAPTPRARVDTQVPVPRSQVTARQRGGPPGRRRGMNPLEFDAAVRSTPSLGSDAVPTPPPPLEAATPTPPRAVGAPLHAAPAGDIATLEALLSDPLCEYDEDAILEEDDQDILMDLLGTGNKNSGHSLLPDEHGSEEGIASRSRQLDPVSQEPQKVINAARQWLRTRRSDETMAARLRALSGLSRGEQQQFVDDNRTRLPGQWVLDVLDKRLSEGVPLSDLQAYMNSSDSASASTAPAMALSVGGTVASTEIAAPRGGAETCSSSSSAKRGLENAARLVTNNLAATSNVRQHQSEVLGGQGTRPRFAPRVPKVGGAERWVPRTPADGSSTLGGNDGLAARGKAASTPGATCRHPMRGKIDGGASDCNWVCLDCGEELWFDGWRLEYVGSRGLQKTPIEEQLQQERRQRFGGGDIGSEMFAMPLR